MKDYTAGKQWKIDKRCHILETAYTLFSESGIVPVSIADVAEASGVGRVTVFRYFTTKLELVIAVGVWKWETYIKEYNASLPQETLDQMSAAQWLRFFLDSFLDLYRNHPDILRFNYDFNSFLRYECLNKEQKQPYIQMTAALGEQFHQMYERGLTDGTLNNDVSERAMFSSILHIMLAAVTSYTLDGSNDPESELEMLKEMLFLRFTK